MSQRNSLEMLFPCLPVSYERRQIIGVEQEKCLALVYSKIGTTICQV